MAQVKWEGKKAGCNEAHRNINLKLEFWPPY
jgi:hypothetical protein